MIVALLSDPIETLKYATDTSVLLAKEFERIGYKIFHFAPKEIYLENGSPKASGRYVSFNTVADYQLQDNSICELSQCYAVLMRHDPPFDMDYLTPLYLLSLIEGRIKCLNRPSRVIANPEKIIVAHFKEFLPKTIITSSEDELINFLQSTPEIVLKPLYGHGGHDVIKLTLQDYYRADIKHYLDQHGHIVVQEFLPAVVEGDKRVVICNGKIMASIARVPMKGEFVANMRVGGRAEKTVLTPKEKHIAEEVGAYLKRQDIFLAGIDLIDQKLIEINITSPTTVKVMKELYGKPFDEWIVKEFINHKNS